MLVFDLGVGCIGVFTLWKCIEHFSVPVLYFNRKFTFKKWLWDFPGGAVVKNPPANARDMGSIPGPGRCHMLQAAKP